MSTLAIVLGIGFLAGVLTFSAGLSATFDGIVKGSTPDVTVRLADTGSIDTYGTVAGSGNLISPAVVDKLTRLDEAGEVHPGVEGMGLYVLDSNGKAVSAPAEHPPSRSTTPTCATCWAARSWAWTADAGPRSPARWHLTLARPRTPGTRSATR